MAEPSPQRAYRAACPGCGAPVEFRSAQSGYAVCSFCRSTVVRSGETLARVGKMAEVFEDHTPLQLLAGGQWQGRAFTLVGRLQYRGETGAWTEWDALFDDGTAGVLGEDHGAYVFLLPAAMQREVPLAMQFRVGSTTAIEGKSYNVASNQRVSLVSAQGELPKLPATGRFFPIVELRSPEGEVLSIDYSSQPPALSRGRSVRLEDLRMSGLRDDSAKEESGRHFACPHCGAPVEVALDSSKCITCRSCNSLIELDGGVGGELHHALQGAPVEPVIPLGSVGRLQGVAWQVVGFRHRIGHEPGDDEEFGWNEFLLYNRQRGFIFLVDSDDGWSVVKPTTGAPALSPGEQSAIYLGTNYELKHSYEAQTRYVAGEYYWPVEQGQKTFNRDFGKGDTLLSMQRGAREVTWFSGRIIASDTVAKAFKLEGKKNLLKRAGAGPTTTAGATGCGTLMLVFLVIILLVGVKGCADDDDTTSVLPLQHTKDIFHVMIMDFPDQTQFSNRVLVTRSERQWGPVHP